METKQGRPRRYTLGTAGVGPELSYLLGMLDELVERVDDQVSHLPPAALNFLGPNSTLSIGRLVLHLVGSDRAMLTAAVPDAPTPPYAEALNKGLLADFSSPPGDLAFAPIVLKQHLVWRRENLLEPCRVEGFLERAPNHAICKTNRELFAHLCWHWTYHSGQIGLIALEAGYDYVWTSTPKS